MEGKMRKWELRALVDCIIDNWTIVCDETNDYIRAARKLETIVSSRLTWRNVIIGVSQRLVTIAIYDKKTDEEVFEFTFDPDELCDNELID